MWNPTRDVHIHALLCRGWESADRPCARVSEGVRILLARDGWQDYRGREGRWWSMHTYEQQGRAHERSEHERFFFKNFNNTSNESLFCGVGRTEEANADASGRAARGPETSNFQKLPETPDPHERNLRMSLQLGCGRFKPGGRGWAGKVEV